MKCSGDEDMNNDAGDQVEEMNEVEESEGGTRRE